MTTTQTRHPVRTVVRTIFQFVPGLAALVPFVLEAIADGDPSRLGPGAVIALAVSSAITRVMALSQVEDFLAVWVPWLAANPDPAPVIARGTEQWKSLVALRAALDEGDPAREGIELVLNTHV